MFTTMLKMFMSVINIVINIINIVINILILVLYKNGNSNDKNVDLYGNNIGDDKEKKRMDDESSIAPSNGTSITSGGSMYGTLLVGRTPSLVAKKAMAVGAGGVRGVRITWYECKYGLHGMNGNTDYMV